MVLFFVVLITARIALVRVGWLFGSGRLLAVDAAISALLVIGVAVARRFTAARPADQPGPAGSLTDWLGIAAAVLGLPGLVISLSNLFAPPTPHGLSVPICAGAPAYGWEYYGVTTGPIGNYARSGPGLNFPQTDRFDANCTLGFEGYCLGDPVTDPFTEWPETRWLLVGRHTRNPARTAARLLSSESGDMRFVTHAYVAPKSPDGDLDYLGDEICGRGRPQPGPVTMIADQPTDAGITFRMQVDNAERVGLALSMPRPLTRAGSAVRMIYSAPVDATGAATITWNADRTVRQLVPHRSEPAYISVLGTSCLGPVGPAAPTQAAVLTFAIASDGTVTPAKTRRPDGDIIDQLNRAACDSEGHDEDPATPSPSPSPSPS